MISLYEELKLGTYYHRKLVNSDTHPANIATYGIDVHQFSVSDWLRTDFARKSLKRANEICGVSVSTLKDVYMEISASSRDSITSTVGQRRLADKIQSSKATVTRAVAGLRSAGLLLTFHRYTADQLTRRRTTSFMVLKGFADYITYKFSQVRGLIVKKLTQFSTYKANPGKRERKNHRFAVLDQITGEVLTLKPKIKPK